MRERDLVVVRAIGDGREAGPAASSRRIGIASMVATRVSAGIGSAATSFCPPSLPDGDPRAAAQARIAEASAMRERDLVVVRAIGDGRERRPAASSRRIGIASMVATRVSAGIGSAATSFCPPGGLSGSSDPAQ
jgi:phosphoketolase